MALIELHFADRTKRYDHKALSLGEAVERTERMFSALSKETGINFVSKDSAPRNIILDCLEVLL